MSSWFRERFSHTGKAKLEFGSPRGSVSGEGTVEVDELGAVTVGFRVDDYEYLDTDGSDEGYELERLLTGNPTMRDDGSGPASNWPAYPFHPWPFTLRTPCPPNFLAPSRRYPPAC